MNKRDSQIYSKSKVWKDWDGVHLGAATWGKDGRALEQSIFHSLYLSKHSGGGGAWKDRSESEVLRPMCFTAGLVKK